MVAADYYYPDWECLVDWFCNPVLKNCWHGRPGIELTTLDLCSQSDVYDLSVTAQNKDTGNTELFINSSYLLLEQI